VGDRQSITVYVRPATAKALRELAERTHVPQSEFVRTGVEVVLTRALAQLEADGVLDWDLLERATP
jgi:predicted transcriptional regulator